MGKVNAFHKAVFPVSIGDHRVQLRIVHTGSSASAEFIVDVRADETRVLRTGRHTFKEFLKLPLAIMAPDRYAPRPWIGLELLDR